MPTKEDTPLPLLSNEPTPITFKHYDILVGSDGNSIQVLLGVITNTEDGDFNALVDIVCDKLLTSDVNSEFIGEKMNELVQRLHRQAPAEQVVRMREAGEAMSVLLKSASCPNCDGRGWYAEPSMPDGATTPSADKRERPVKAMLDLNRGLLRLNDRYVTECARQIGEYIDHLEQSAHV